MRSLGHGRDRKHSAGLLTLATAVTVLAVSGCTNILGSKAASSSSGLSSSSTPSASGSTSPSSPPASSGSSSGIPVEAGAQQVQNAFEQAIKKALPSVVEIRTTQGLGSGVVFDNQGNVVTNAHVVGTATSFQVYLAGSAQPVAASLVGSYPPDDLAVIRLASPNGAQGASFAPTGQTKVGDLVLAMGNPLGLASSVTDGIVSALGRTITEPASAGSPGATIPNAIQTSASINPGNSGGALVNLAGQVVGIPTLAALSPESGAQAPGIGFAISADTVNLIAPQLIKDGRVTNSGRAALGVTVTTVTNSAGEPAGVGVVRVVPGGPAATAGIAAGDVITQVAGQPVSTEQDLAGVLAQQKVGTSVPVQLQRNGSSQTVTVTLGSLP